MSDKETEGKCFELKRWIETNEMREIMIYWARNQRDTQRNEKREGCVGRRSNVKTNEMMEKKTLLDGEAGERPIKMRN